VNASVPGRSKQSVELRRGPAKFPRSARLLRHSDFERVYQQGRRHFSANLTLFYLPTGVAGASRNIRGPIHASAGFRVGFTVGRALGGAVERNRMKRRLREAVRLSWPEHPPNADVVINPKKSVLKVEVETLLNEVRRAFVVVAEKLGNASGLASNADTRMPEARK
jgi:ribonuclease P protein component